MGQINLIIKNHIKLAIDIITKFKFEILDLDEITYLGIDNPDKFSRLFDDSFIEDSKMEYVDDINIIKHIPKIIPNQQNHVLNMYQKKQLLL